MRKRFVVCAACNYGDIIIAGARHYDKVMTSQLRALKANEEVELMNLGLVVQGFIDQFGVFMDRKEALQVAIDSGQPIDWDRNSCRDELYSEGLY